MRLNVCANYRLMIKMMTLQVDILVLLMVKARATTAMLIMLR